MMFSLIVVNFVDRDSRVHHRWLNRFFLYDRLNGLWPWLVSYIMRGKWVAPHGHDGERVRLR